MTTRLRKAIDAMCRDCCYDPRSGLGTWRQQSESCVCHNCPLYPVRPKVYRRQAALSGHSDGTQYLTPTQPAQVPKCGPEGRPVGQKGVCLGVAHG